MHITTIQIDTETKKKLDQKRHHPRESYNDVLKRMVEADALPKLEEMFRLADQKKQKKVFSTKEVIELSHGMRS